MARLCRPVLLFACLPLLHGCGGQRPNVESKQAADTSPRPQASVATQSNQSSPARPDTSRLDSVPQGPHAELRGGDYIQSVFQEKVGESPRMGWFLSTRFLAAEKHQHVYIYSNRAVIDTAVFERTLSASQHDSLAHQQHLACDEEKPLAEYRLHSTTPPEIKRAFYTSKLPTGAVRAILSVRPPSGDELVVVRTLLPTAHASVLYRDTVLTGSASNASYAVSAVYDSTTHALLKSALILRDSTGRVVGSELKTSEDFGCDGCGDPQYEEGLGRLYDVINAFEVPGFAYPLLLLDTGTVEGRALSLVTFTPDGGYTEYRIYEYVVTCILGPDTLSGS